MCGCDDRLSGLAESVADLTSRLDVALARWEALQDEVDDLRRQLWGITADDDGDDEDDEDDDVSRSRLALLV